MPPIYHLASHLQLAVRLQAIVLSVRHDMADIHAPDSGAHVDDEAVLVPSNIEYRSFMSEKADRGEVPADGVTIRAPCAPHDPEPCPERWQSVRMPPSKR